MKTVLSIILAVGMAGATLRAADKSPTFTSARISIDANGDGLLVVDTRGAKEAHRIDSRPNEKPAELKVFGDADAFKLNDGRFHLVYDFSKFKNVAQLQALAVYTEEQKVAFRDQIKIDEEEGVLAINPFSKKVANLHLPRFMTPPLEIRVDLLGHSEGAFQLVINSTKGGYLASLALHGDHSPTTGMSPGTVILYQGTEPKTPAKILLKMVQEPNKLQEYRFTTVAKDDIATVLLHVRGNTPIAITRLEMTGNMVPSFGVTLVARESKVIVGHVFDGGAADAAGLKASDVLEKVNGKAVNGFMNAKKLLAECEFGKEASFTVSRYGKERKFNVIPK